MKEEGKFRNTTQRKVTIFHTCISYSRHSGLNEFVPHTSKRPALVFAIMRI